MYANHIMDVYCYIWKIQKEKLALVKNIKAVYDAWLLYILYRK